MTALGVALALVGLAAVAATRDVALRWLSGREQTRELRGLVERARDDSEQALGLLRHELAARCTELEGDVRALREREREERLARLGGGRRA